MPDPTTPASPAPDKDVDPSHITDLLAESAAALGRCGFPVSQGRLMLEEVAAAYGRPVDSALFPTLVMTEDRRSGLVALRRVPGGYRFDQAARAQQVISDARDRRVTPSAAARSLRDVATAAPPVPSWLRLVGYALSAVGFAACFRLSLDGLAAAAVLGALVGAALLLSRRDAQVTALMPVLATFGSALLVSLASLALSIPDPVRLAAIPVLVLLPGAALTAATIELVSGDMMAGASRLVYAVMQLVAMAFGFLLAIQLVGVGRGRLVDLTQQLTPPWTPWIGVVVFAVGTMLYFCTPRRLWVWTLLVILLSYGTQVLAQQMVSSTLATGVASGVALVIAWGINARVGGGPVAMVLFLPTFWMLVPGSLGFVAIAGAMSHDQGLSDAGLQVVVSILAMSIGIMVACLAVPALHSLGHRGSRAGEQPLARENRIAPPTPPADAASVDGTGPD